MKHKNITLLIVAFLMTFQLTACSIFSGTADVPEGEGDPNMSQKQTNETSLTSKSGYDASQNIMNPTAEIATIIDGFSIVRHEGEYGFDAFLAAGGASSDGQVVRFLVQNGLKGAASLSMRASGFGCSTISVKSPSGGMLFGRNFDWEQCNALVVSAKPKNGYDSVSTVNMDFLGNYIGLLPESTRTRAALYAPMDGMNERGLTAAVLMISDSDSIDQDTEKPDITTTTAIRLLLDKAATVDEAIALLEQYDMHASMNMMVHFSLADAMGKSVVVEYINDQMTVIETPIATNFYLAEGEKNGIGTAQSHTRYDILTEQLAKTPTMDTAAVRDAMQSVSKQNFGEFESTEWSIVYDQSNMQAHYYHRENYDQSYTFDVK